jgi:hypothetical protein
MIHLLQSRELTLPGGDLAVHTARLQRSLKLPLAFASRLEKGS